MGLTPLRERRQRATRWFTARVFLLVVLIGLIAYGAWIAPRTQRSQKVLVEVVR